MPTLKIDVKPRSILETSCVKGGASPNVGDENGMEIPFQQTPPPTASL